ncbi:MAG: hypothetical protein AAF679_03430, partial [Pseudomonadota bacterium]
MLSHWRFGPVLGLVTCLAGAVAAQDLKLVRIGTLDVRSDFVQAGSGIYVSGHRSDTGNELWRIGQRPDRLELVRDIFGTKPNGAQGHANPRGLTAFQGRLYFFASRSEIPNLPGLPRDRVSNGLWVTDGSEGGTRLLMAFEPVREDKRSAPPLVEAGGALFFTAEDEEHGLELWRTSGTRETTVLVRDLWRGVEGSTSVMGAVEEQVLFAGSDGRVGGELWQSDGTSRGTVLVRDINGVPAPSTIDLVGETLSVIDGEAYFAANDSRHGTELWRTTEGRQDAQMVLDLTEGPGSSRFEDMRVAGESLFVAQVVSNSGAL